jgi:branched-chain amino acid transport system permease protein
MVMLYALDQLINGLTLGSIYGLIAIGYTMVYGIVGMINFAHGEIYMIGAFLTLIAIVALNAFGLVAIVPILVIALAVAVVFTAGYGWVVERVAYRPLRGSFRLAPLISAIGMSIFLQNYVQLMQGARVRAIPPMIEGGVVLLRRGTAQLSMSWMQLVIVGVTITVMAGTTLIIHRTPLGRAQRACEQNPGMAALLGVNVDRVISLTFVMGAVLAAVAGFLVTLYYGSIDFFIGFLAGLKAFTAAVLGGIGSLPGAMLGGLLIGLIEAFWSGYLSIEFKDVAVFATLILVLLLRPNGLLGRSDVEKV